MGYRACLWSRTATRVLLSLGSVDATSSQTLYAGALRIDWREHFAPDATLACDCTGANDAIKHTIYGAQLLKDAVCVRCAKPPVHGPTCSLKNPVCNCICTWKARKR